MLFTKYIKNNTFLNQSAILISNFIIKLINFFNFNQSKNEIDNIVVVALHRLGDSVFTIPALVNIVNHFGENISLICFPETQPIYNVVYKNLKYTIIEHKELLFDNRIARKKARNKLESLKPSLIFDLTGTITSATLLLRSSASKIIGINEPYYRSIYTDYRLIRTIPHLIDNYIEAIRGIIPINITEYNCNQDSQSGGLILIHPFTSLEEKEWGLKKYITLAESLNENYRTVIVTPVNRIPNDVCIELQQKKIQFIETKSVYELIEVIKKCTIFIGNDSGPTNIANLLGKPTFTIYGPTNPDFHKPKKGTNDFILKRRNCSAQNHEKMCFTQRTLKGCPSYECINNLSINEVKIKVIDFIHKIEINNQSA